jgi:hypothetical protein
MRTTGSMAGFLPQFLFQRLQENVKYIEMKATHLPHDPPNFSLHHRLKNDRSRSRFLGSFVDFCNSLSRLVFTIYKWQSHLPKILAVKLGQKAVSEGFGSDTRLVRNKENRAFAHLMLILKGGGYRIAI